MARTRHVAHSITMSAPVHVVYGLVADVERWPVHFAPTVHAERLEGDDSQERIRLWALAHGAVRDWVSRRWLDRDRGRVEFRQEVPASPVASMSGCWVLEALPGDRTKAVLTHDFSAVDDDPEGLDLIDRAVDRNSVSELESLRRTAEEHAVADERVLSFVDAVEMRGSVEDAYDFLYRCGEWPVRLPHVSRLDVRQQGHEVQFMEMDTRSGDDTVHTTESVRVCFPSRRIVYKQTRTPPIMRAHVGEWLVEARGAGVSVSSRHTVVLKPETAAGLLGQDVGVAEVRDRVRRALSANSLSTLQHAKEYVEARGAD